MPKLTQTQVARIYALYYGCNYLIIPANIEGNPVIGKVDWKLLRDIQNDNWLGNEATPTELLLLRPISSITPEQVFALCKIAYPLEFGDYRFSKWEVSADPSNSKNWDGYFIKNANATHQFLFDAIDGEIICTNTQTGEVAIANQTYRQWYFENGFAISLYPYDKNALELDLALNAGSYPIPSKSILNI